MAATVTVKYLEICKPGELVRAYFTEQAQWAIIGYVEDGEGARKNAVVVFSGAESPLFLNPQDIEASGGTTCLSYGTQFDLLPEQSGACELFGPMNPRPVPPGVLIYARAVAGDETTNRYLGTTREGRLGMFLDLATFKIGEQPGGYLANFPRWSIWASLPPRPDRPTQLFEYKHRAQET